MRELLAQLAARQEQFAASVAVAQGLNEVSAQSGALRRDVADMESEKKLVLGKIQRLHRKISDIVCNC